MKEKAFKQAVAKTKPSLFGDQRRKFYQMGYNEAENDTIARVKRNIGMLRQWLNERPQNMLVTNKQLETWILKQ